MKYFKSNPEGGQLVHYLALEYPQLIRKMVIIAAAYKLGPIGIETEKKCLDYFQDGKLGKAMGAIMESVLKPGLKRTLVMPFIKTFGKIMFGKIEYPNDFANEIRADKEMNFLDRLHEIKVQTLILCGKNDVFYDYKDVKSAAEKISNANHIIYDKYGHNLMMSNKKQVNRDILEFLNEDT